MDGGGRTHSQGATQPNPSHQDVTGGTGAAVDPMTAQGITSSKPQLQSRSPFVSSLRESDLQHHHHPQNLAGSSALSQRLPPASHQPHIFSHPKSMPAPLHSHLPPNSGIRDEGLFSRGVLSHQSGGPQPHSSGHTSFTSSGLSSYNGSSSMDPLVNYSAMQPQAGIGGYPSNYGQTSGGASRYNASGGHVALSNVGSRLQGQGNVYPHMSEYQPMHNTAAPPHSSAYNSGSSNLQDHRYHSQRMHPQLRQQPVYSIHQPVHYGHMQAQNASQHYKYQTPGIQSRPGAPSYYGQTPSCQYEFGYQEPAPSPAYQPPYSTSSVPSTPYQYQQQIPSSVPYDSRPAETSMGVGPSMLSSSSMHSYYGPHNEYPPSSVPYQPLQSSSSASSSNWSTPPLNEPTHRYSSGSYAGMQQAQSVPQPQGQPVPAGHYQSGHQSRYTPSQNAQYFSSSQGSSMLPKPKGTYYPVHGSGDDDQPQGEDIASGDLSAYSGSGAGEGGESTAGGEKCLVHNFEKLKLHPHTPDENCSSGPVGKQPPGSEGCSSRVSNYSWSNDGDGERTCSSYLSGGLSSMQEQLEDKTGFLPTIEILDHPRDCTVALNGTLKLTCKAKIIGSKLEEEPDYLWYREDEPLVGEISGEYVVEKVGEGERGRYFCLVSHPDGKNSVKSQIAIVAIKTSGDSRAPVLTHQPEAYVEAVKGEPLVLSIHAEGEPPLRYTWFKGTQELQYCSESVLRVTSAGPLDNGQYCCTVSNDYGSVLSDVVLVKVVLQRTIPPPLTRSSPSRKRYSSNPDDEIPDDRTLRWLARPVARHTKNWARLALYLGLLPTDAADTQHYQASPEQKAYHLLREWRKRKQGTLYALKTILSQAGISLQEPSHTSPSPSPVSSLSSSIQQPSFSISSHPQDVIVVYGQEAKLEVRTDGLGQMCSYQWYKDGRKLLGKTQKSMVIASTVDSDEGSYTCLISNSEGSVMSHPATITVVSVAPQSSQQPKPTRPVVERRSHPTHLPIPPQYRNTGASYGLTGRGVDDDDCDERISEPSYTAAVPSIPSSTAPPKAMTGSVTITEHPKSHVAPLGSSVTLTCKASPSSGGSQEDLNYVWYMNGLSLLEHTTPEYHIASLTEEDEGMYSCEVSTVNQSVMSQMASVFIAK